VAAAGPVEVGIVAEDEDRVDEDDDDTE